MTDKQTQKLAMLSCLAYEEVESTQDVMPGHLVLEIANKNARCIVVFEGKHATVAFEGTKWSDSSDLWHDINCEMAMYYGHRVHAGFAEHADLVLEDLKEALNRYGVETLSVTGHSLGGAAATLAAYALSLHQFDITELVTFGSPVVGNRAFCRAIERLVDRIDRHVNNNDIVPRIKPPGYEHCRVLHYHTRNGETLISPRWWTVAMDRALGRARAIREGLTDGITDHFMASYLRAVS